MFLKKFTGLQGQGIECFTANPGIVNTPLNGPKLDHNKLTGNLMDITSSLAGQSTEEASICITRAATDPALEGRHSIKSILRPDFRALMACRRPATCMCPHAVPALIVGA